MPLLSFQPWKAKKVEACESLQTIRAARERPIKAGDVLYLWQSQRSPQLEVGRSRLQQRRSRQDREW